MFDQKAYQRKWYKAHREEIRERKKALRVSRRVIPSQEEIALKKQRSKEIHAMHNDRWRQRHPEIAKAIRNRGDEKLKSDVLTAYGNGKKACVRCGFDDIRALSVDHIDGGGNAHRNMNKGRFQGRKLYVYLRQQGYPIGYQTLCMNCQWIKRHENQEYGKRDLGTE